MGYEKLGFVSGQTLKAEHLNHMEEGIANAGGGADWNAKEGEAGYVQNRTHWEEQLEDIVILPEATFTPEEMDGVLVAPLPNTFTLKEGVTYKVNWNGETYQCKAVGAMGSIFIGNLDAIGSPVEGAGEPFGIGYSQEYGERMVFVNDGSTEVVLSVSEISNVVHKLDKKFLPDDIGGGVKFVKVGYFREQDVSTYGISLSATATYEEIADWIKSGIDVKVVYEKWVATLQYSDALYDIATFEALSTFQHVFTHMVLGDQVTLISIRIDSDDNVYIDEAEIPLTTE